MVIGMVVTTVVLNLISIYLLFLDMNKNPLDRQRQTGGAKQEAAEGSAFPEKAEHTNEEDKPDVLQGEPAQTDKAPDDKPRLTRELLIYGIVMILLTVGIAVTMALLYTDNTFIFSIKRICLLSLLWPIAYIDLKSYRIPNLFIGAGLTYRGIILAFELFLENENLLHTVIADVIAAVALGLAALLCGLLIKNSIGFGDVKLFIVMGLLLSLDGIWSSIFVSLIISFVLSVILLISKKRTRKDVVPFGPALMAGTFISVFLTGM